MQLHPRSFALTGTLFAATLFAGVWLGGSGLAGSAPGVSSFLSASAGNPVASQSVALPPVGSGTSTSVCAGAPTRRDLLTQNRVVRTAREMKAHWAKLFDVSYDPMLFDFDQDFVILAVGGKLTIESFSISGVEKVDATWASLFFGQQNDPFLAVTTLKVLPGIPPPVPPPPTWRISAVRVSKSMLDDVVFHASVLAAP